MRERKGAVGGNPMLLLRVHLAERAVMAVGAENRIVAEPGRPARREDERAIDPPLERLERAIRPREGQHTDEGGAPRRRRAERFEFTLDPRHGAAEVLAPARPARRIDPRRAA